MKHPWIILSLSLSSFFLAFATWPILGQETREFKFPNVAGSSQRSECEATLASLRDQITQVEDVPPLLSMVCALDAELRVYHIVAEFSVVPDFRLMVEMTPSSGIDGALYGSRALCEADLAFYKRPPVPALQYCYRKTGYGSTEQWGLMLVAIRGTDLRLFWAKFPVLGGLAESEAALLSSIAERFQSYSGNSPARLFYQRDSQLGSKIMLAYEGSQKWYFPTSLDVAFTDPEICRRDLATAREAFMGRYPEVVAFFCESTAGQTGAHLNIVSLSRRNGGHDRFASLMEATAYSTYSSCQNNQNAAMERVRQSGRDPLWSACSKHGTRFYVHVFHTINVATD